MVLIVYENTVLMYSAASLQRKRHGTNLELKENVAGKYRTCPHVPRIPSSRRTRESPGPSSPRRSAPSQWTGAAGIASAWGPSRSDIGRDSDWFCKTYKESHQDATKIVAITLIYTEIVWSTVQHVTNKWRLLGGIHHHLDTFGRIHRRAI